MAQLLNEVQKINFKPELSFGQRKRTINENIQKHIDLYKSKGYIVIDHKLNVETATYASIQFTLQKMISR
jgi:predicted GNAT superfamily acetyltransferase